MKRLVCLVSIAIMLGGCGGGNDPSTPVVAVAPDSAVRPEVPSAPPPVSPPVAVPGSTIDPMAIYVATRRVSLQAAVQLPTIEPAPSGYINFYSSFDSGLGESLVISSAADLDALNKKLSATERKVSLPDLDRYTYFLVKAPGCPDYLEYVGAESNQGKIDVTVNHFRRITALCLAVLVDPYYLLRAKK